MKVKKIKWLSRSRDYYGHQLRAGSRVLKVELSKVSQDVLAYDNNCLIAKQKAEGSL